MIKQEMIIQNNLSMFAPRFLCKIQQTRQKVYD